MATEEGLGIEYDEDVICDVCRAVSKTPPPPKKKGGLMIIKKSSSGALQKSS